MVTQGVSPSAQLADAYQEDGSEAARTAASPSSMASTNGDSSRSAIGEGRHCMESVRAARRKAAQLAEYNFGRTYHSDIDIDVVTAT